MITTYLPAVDRIATPWKNHGGVTREIAAWPAGAGLEDFAWRISMAEVRDPGAFSPFPEVDRCLTVLRGALTLTFGETVVFLDGLSAPLEFRGDQPCQGMPVAGPVLDLNVMCRRGQWRSRVERMEDATWRPSGQTAFLLALEPAVVGARTLSRFDALLFDDLSQESPPLHLVGSFIAVSLEPMVA